MTSRKCECGGDGVIVTQSAVIGNGLVSINVRARLCRCVEDILRNLMDKVAALEAEGQARLEGKA